MRNDIINYLEKEIKSRCESEKNFFGEGIDFVKNKLERSYKKLSDSGKEIFAEKYRTAMLILG